MINSLLLKGLVNQESKTTTTQIALWEEMSIWKVAYKKLRFKKNAGEEINNAIEKKSNILHKVYGIDPLNLANRLQKHLFTQTKIDFSKISTIRELDELCISVENEAVQLQKQLSKGEFKGNSIEELIKYTIQKIFDDLSNEFSKKSSNEQDNIVKQIFEILKEMPDDQKEKLQKELNVSELSQQTIRKAITTGSLGIAFAALVEIAGFSAYIFATKTLAVIAGIIGLTLPFSVYVALTSFMAFLANPFVLVLLLTGFLSFITKKSNKKIRNAFLPNLVSQIAISSTIGEPSIDKLNKLVKFYEV